MTARLTRLLVPLASAALLLACTGGEATPTSTATSSTPTTTAATVSATGSATATATSGAATPTPTANATAAAAVVLATPAAPTAVAPAAQPQRTPAPIVTSAAPPPSPAPTSASSDIAGFAFGPASITRGGSVTWVNRDPVQHDVVAKDGSFRSPILEAGQSYSARSDTAGTFAYICSIHPFMAGTVVVQ